MVNSGETSEFRQIDNLFVQAQDETTHSIKDFIRPNDVVHLYLTHSSTYDAWRLVESEVEQVSSEEGEDLWQFPLDTWRRRVGDCEAKASLLASILRNWSENVYVVGGIAEGKGHAWVIVNGQIIDPSSRRFLVHAQDYDPFMYWNDREIFIRAGFEQKLKAAKFGQCFFCPII